MAATTADHWRMIWAIVAKIPRGRVASYGEVALAAGLPGRARMVGRALSGLPPESRVPWHRVVNASGRISLDGADAERQARLLRREGVEIGPTGRIDLRRFRV